MRGSQRVTDENPEGKYQALEKYTPRSHRRWPATASSIRSSAATRRSAASMQVLSRRTKNNPVLIGEPGRRQDGDRRGHRAAHRHRRRARVAQGQAHPVARPRRADRRHQVSRRVRGSPEGGAQGDRGGRRRRSSCSSTSCTRWSAPARAEGALDAANMLKPALARGELRCIGATTLDEYRKHIEKDKALERRFQPVFVGEPSRRRHDRDPARPQGKLRGAPRHPHPRRRAGRGGAAVGPLHHRPLPARQGDRSDRRGRQPPQDADRLAADADRSAASGG